MNILVTGGLGYLGSHAVVELIKQKYKVFVIDNLSNSHIQNLSYLEKITSQKIEFLNADIRDKQKLDKIFKDNDISGIMHFAGLKSVKKSDSERGEYYDVNVNGTKNCRPVPSRPLLWSRSPEPQGKGDGTCVCA